MPSEEWVFTEVFKVPAADGTAVDIRAWGIPSIDAEGLGFLADRAAIGITKLAVEGLSQGGGGGVAGRITRA